MFSIRDLSTLHYANGFTMWHLKQGDLSFADIARPGFFNDADSMLAPGDIIMVTGVDGAMELVVRECGAMVRTSMVKATEEVAA